MDREDGRGLPAKVRPYNIIAIEMHSDIKNNAKDKFIAGFSPLPCTGHHRHPFHCFVN
jgi:hypothetical protein